MLIERKLHPRWLTLQITKKEERTLALVSIDLNPLLHDLLVLHPIIDSGRLWIVLVERPSEHGGLLVLPALDISQRTDVISGTWSIARLKTVLVPVTHQEVRGYGLSRLSHLKLTVS